MSLEFELQAHVRFIFLVVFPCYLGGGCLFATPIELERAETNYPPVIETSGISPADNPIVITEERYTEEYRIEVPLKDPNSENELHYAWLTDQNGLESDGSTTPQNQPNSNSTLFKRFNPVDFTFDPCTKIQGPDLILHLVISDAPFSSTGGIPEAFRVNKGFTDAYTWKISTSPGVCER